MIRACEYLYIIGDANANLLRNGLVNIIDGARILTIHNTLERIHV
jgi:hypothetical protein